MSNLVNTQVLARSIIEDSPTSLHIALLRGKIAKSGLYIYRSLDANGARCWIWKSHAEREIMLPDVDFSSRSFPDEYRALKHALEMIEVQKIPAYTPVKIETQFDDTEIL